VSLHILNSTSSLSRCQFSLTDGDAVILIEDAVLLAASNIEITSGDASIYALSDDIDRRGVNLVGSVTLVDYSGFVELCAQHRHCLSW